MCKPKYEGARAKAFLSLFESIAIIRKDNPEVAKQYHGALIKFYVELEELIKGL